MYGFNGAGGGGGAVSLPPYCTEDNGFHWKNFFYEQMQN